MRNVERALLRARVWFDIKEFTLEKDPMSVMSCVAEAFLRKPDRVLGDLKGELWS